MKVDRYRYMIDDARRWLSANGWQRGKLIGICAVLAPLLIWIAINTVSGLMPEPPASAPDTPGWRVAQELNEALVNEPGFSGVAFNVKSESPLRLELTGGVASEEVLEDLETFAATLRPERDYDVAVELWNEITNAQPTSEGEPVPDDGEQPTDNG